MATDEGEVMLHYWPTKRTLKPSPRLTVPQVSPRVRIGAGPSPPAIPSRRCAAGANSFSTSSVSVPCAQGVNIQPLLSRPFHSSPSAGRPCRAASEALQYSRCGRCLTVRRCTLCRGPQGGRFMPFTLLLPELSFEGLTSFRSGKVCPSPRTQLSVTAAAMINAH